METTPEFFYKIVLENDEKKHVKKKVEAFKKIIEQFEDTIINVYSIYNVTYLFIKTYLDLSKIQEILSDLVDRSEIYQIQPAGNISNDKIIVFCTMIPQYLQNEQKFNTFIESFLHFFKIPERISSILYCIRCQSSSDASRFINFVREINFGQEEEEHLLVDTNILNLPIVQVVPNIITTHIIAKYDYHPIYSTVSPDYSIFIFQTLDESEAFINKFNGVIFQKQLITVRHFVDQNTFSQLKKYEIRFKISELLQKSNDEIKELQITDIYHECFSFISRYGNIFSFIIDNKNHGNVIFENEEEAKKMVKDDNINVQFINDSIFIGGFPPDMTIKTLKTLLAKSSFILKDVEEYVLEPYDKNEILSKKITSPIFRIQFSDITEVDKALEKIKKINFGLFSPFYFKNKIEFEEQYKNITSINTVLITGLPSKSTPSDIVDLCKALGQLRLFIHIKTSRNSNSAIAAFSKNSEFENAKKNLNQIVFQGSHLIVKKFALKKQNDNTFTFKLTKKSAFDAKRQKAKESTNQNETSINKAQKSIESKKQKELRDSENETNNSKPRSVPMKMLQSNDVQKPRSVPPSIVKIEKPQKINQMLEINKILKCEPLPPRIPKKSNLKIIPFDFQNIEKKLEEEKPDFI